ncbi:hypothetical protein [Acinetobacter dispersus]|uniref:hypothetical protein n=1 Tax=Acinetobacter dispersus TaxID=70348 RepID=UPI00132EE9B0|nr:hypothetical protein [Acinetobacter dispersus]QHH97311.1 hypothetical protein FPL17_06990 [Acinetobacter dispersus]
MFSIEKSKKSKLETYKEILVEHWGVLIFIPAILGGLLQVLKLANMDSSFVRFFAVEQVVPDGLLVIFLSFLSYLIYKGFSQINFKAKNTRLGWNIINFLRYTISYLLLIGMLSYFVYGIYKGNANLVNVIMRIVFEFLIVQLVCYYYITINYLYYFRSKKDYSEVSDYDFKQFFKKIIFYDKIGGASLYGLIILIFVMAFFYEIADVYSELNKIKNIENEIVYITKVKNKLSIKEDLSVEYYNGKYIFLKRHGNNNDNQYFVLKGDGFVNLLDEK